MPTGRAPKRDQSERRCLVSGRTADKAALVRFVVDPSGRMVADLAEDLPGRGFWVGAERALIEQAVGRKHLARAARRAGLEAVEVPADLADQVERLLLARCQRWLGLARRAGVAAQGFEQVRAALAAGRAAVLVEATDAARPMARDGRAAAVETVTVMTGDELGQAFGRDRAVHVALAAGGLTVRFLHDARRLGGLRRALDLG